MALDIDIHIYLYIFISKFISGAPLGYAAFGPAVRGIPRPFFGSADGGNRFAEAGPRGGPAWEGAPRGAQLRGAEKPVAPRGISLRRRGRPSFRRGRDGVQTRGAAQEKKRRGAGGRKKSPRARVSPEREFASARRK